MDQLCYQCSILMRNRKEGSTLVEIASRQEKATIKIINNLTNIPDPLKSIQFNHLPKSQPFNTLLQLPNFSNYTSVIALSYKQKKDKCKRIDDNIHRLIELSPSQLKTETLQLNEGELVKRLKSIAERKLQQKNYIISSFLQALLLVNFLSVFVINLAMLMQLIIMGKAYSSIPQINGIEMNGVLYIYIISIIAPPIIKAINDYCKRAEQQPLEIFTQIFCEIFMLGPLLYSLQFYLQKKQFSSILPNYRRKIQNQQQKKSFILIYLAHSFKSIIYLSYYKTLEIYFIIRDIQIPLICLAQIFSLLDIGLCFALYFIRQLTRRLIKQQIKNSIQQNNNDLRRNPQNMPQNTNQIQFIRAS